MWSNYAFHSCLLRSGMRRQMPSGSEHQHLSVLKLESSALCIKPFFYCTLTWATFLSGKGPFSSIHLFFFGYTQANSCPGSKSTFLCTVLLKLLSLVWRKQIKCGSHKKNVQHTSLWPPAEEICTQIWSLHLDIWMVACLRSKINSLTSFGHLLPSVFIHAK